MIWILKANKGKPKRQIQELIKSKRFNEAAELFLIDGDYQQALSHFLKAKNFSRAGRVCEMMGNFLAAAEHYEKAKAWEDAVKAYKEAGKIEQAGKILCDQSLFDQAGKLYEEAGLLPLAAEVYGENHQYQEAGTIYLRLENFPKAGDMFSQEMEQKIRAIRGPLNPNQWQWICEMAKKGAEAYQKGDQKEKAADLFLKGEEFKLAADLYREIKQFDKAKEAYAKGKLYSEAAKMFEENGKMEEAYQMQAEDLKRQGQNNQAAELFSKGKDFSKAAELYLQKGDLKKAAYCYKEGMHYAEAAPLFSQISDHENAAICYEKSNSAEEAATHYGKAGNKKKQIELFLTAGKNLQAGRLCIEENKIEQAIRILQKIPETESGFRIAASLLGKIFFDKGMLGVSLKKFQQSIQKDTINSNNIKDYYHMAIIHEKMGELMEAAAILEQILATQYQYEDVPTRLGKIQLEISRQREGAPPLTNAFQAPAQYSRDPGDSPNSPSKTQMRFEVLGEIGRGGMGIVYKARDRILNREVALKYLPANFSNNSLAIKNFQREAQSTAQLNHPGIVTVYDVGYDDRGNYIAMEFLEGISLKDYIKSHGKMDSDQVLTLVSQMTSALGYAHKNKIIHRDIKTSNMMWCNSGVVKLMDFGLAKFISEARNASTQISGTPYYMSPEQTLGKDVDHRTDIYSLGICLFEMVTGEVPFREGDIGYHHVNTPCPDPLEKNPNLTPSLRNIIIKCMQKNSEERFQSTDELGAELEKSKTELKQKMHS